MAWPVQYLRDHAVHLAVIAFFAAYPGVYAVLTNSPVGQEMAYLLPRVETMIAVFYFGLFAMSFDFISGYTGYLSFGHAAFYGAGAYLVVLASNGKIPFVPVDTPFVALLVLGGFVALALAVIIGVVSFRLTGVYFAMITLGFSQVLYVFIRDWDYVGSNPRDGIAVLERTAPFNIGVPGVDALNLAIGQLAGESVEGFLGFLTFSPAEVSYYMVGLVVAGCYFALQRIVHSPFGRVLIAIRENEERARAVGYDTFRYKLGAFALSAFFAGVAGGLFAGFRRSVTPENSFYFLVAGDALLAAIIGGFGTIAGPLFGRLFDETIREFLSKGGEGGGLLPFIDDTLGEATLSTVLYDGLTVNRAIDTFLNGHAALYLGIVFVLFVLYVPNGLLGTLRDRLGGTVADRLPARAVHLVRARTVDQSTSDDD
ncbi:amino acid/amide ABC transporter membrane protein 2, haat family [Halogeometricum borinquense DSM 11551]|uniref:amino acid/amide ABC transporter membrane protein 2, HAAT family n=1 Tax=Halogeometricum borinquense (strain ATCC 700274 / DSM 11551 / JCM 10706 / KCTC 4070 / PR3) TaxID=469382 RepID=E4NTK7_HALBP|nr:branched-chain amino acid ABC transporter permease [Halogeometricum borinquense]ADQ67059.1 amino acid/amide ABC transporter membrane protein 2, HAAT family [Halogeometricum borinquense DSM 11551]ELY29606.1 amino acid/amide ABC transporter membrane protein 2, haat family [Halogeometricum borinquense DSM 11551]